MEPAKNRGIRVGLIGTEDSGQCSAPVAQLEFGLRERTKRIVGREIQSEGEEEKKLGPIGKRV